MIWIRVFQVTYCSFVIKWVKGVSYSFLHCLEVPELYCALAGNVSLYWCQYSELCFLPIAYFLLSVLGDQVEAIRGSIHILLALYGMEQSVGQVGDRV